MADPAPTSLLRRYLGVYRYTWQAARLVWGNCRQAPRTSLADSRTWLLAAACFSGLLLPARLHRSVMRWGTSCQRRLVRLLYPKL